MSNPSQTARVVIPPGQEAVVAQMLNPPAGLAGGWRLARAVIQDDSIAALYQGPDGERARVVLRAKEGAPPKWGRTAQFAVGLAIDGPRPSAAVLYRAVLEAVRAAEPGFAWAAVAGARDPAAAAAVADDGRAAEAEIDLHLDLTPYIDLGLRFDHAAAFAEARALQDRFVAYQSDARYGITGWRGLALQALDGDAAHVATTADDAGIFEDQSRYRRTDVAALCPVTMALLEEVLDLANCRTVSFLMLLPGARIAPHADGVGPPVMRSLNIALNMPEGCRLVIDCALDGGDTPSTRIAPFRPGTGLVLNVAKPHYVVNDSAEPRIHVVARGSLRLPARRVLALAEAQNGLAGTAALTAALAAKRRALGVEVQAPEPAAAPAAPVLSPFVATLAEAARDRLLDLLALGEAVRAAAVGPAEQGGAAWRGVVELRLPSGSAAVLDFEGATPQGRAWCRTAHLACSYRSDAGNPFADPRDAVFLNALGERLARADPAGPRPAPAVAALLAALEAYRPYLPVKDEDYRIVFHGAGDPVGIVWLGFACNQDCRMCWQGRDWPAPPEAMFERWIAELCRAGVRSLIFSGGEPTLQPRLPQWLRQARTAGIPVTLETNAVRFTEPGVLEELLAAGVDSIVVSLHAAEARLSDALTQTPGSWQRTQAGIRSALAAGARVGIHCVVERDNVEGLEAHARYVAALRDGERRITHVSYSFPIGYHRRAAYADAIVPLDVLRPRLSAAMRILAAADVEVRVLGSSGFTPCAIEAPAGLVETLPALRDEQRSADRTFVEACAACSARSRCLGLHVTYVAAHGSRGVVPLT
jgi:pyruvate-formate lyase-activating enzyme